MSISRAIPKLNSSPILLQKKIAYASKSFFDGLVAADFFDEEVLRLSLAYVPSGFGPMILPTSRDARAHPGGQSP
jgi:hypothetical protein